MSRHGVKSLLEHGSIKFKAISEDYVRRDSVRVFLHPVDANQEPTSVVFFGLDIRDAGTFSCELFVANPKSQPIEYKLSIYEAATNKLLFEAAVQALAGERRTWQVPLPRIAETVDVSLSTAMQDGVSTAHAWAWLSNPQLINRMSAEVSGESSRSAVSPRVMAYGSEGVYAQEDEDRVCLCIVMNHPHPENIAKLDAMYAHRFKNIVYLVPFYVSEDPRVITVYRGSYCHNAYVTDAKNVLEAMDITHVVVCQDDVLLNPRLNGKNFTNVFGLGVDDGFIDRFLSLWDLDEFNAWHWGVSVLTKMLFSRGSLWGSGVDYENLFRYLPPRQVMAEKMRQHGLLPADGLSLKSKTVAQFVAGFEANSLFGVFSDNGDERSERNRRAYELIVENIFDYTGAGGTIDLRYDFVMTGPQADFYVIPKSRLADFAHYSGVLGASQLFAEVATPTALLLAAKSVRTSKDLGIRTSFMTHGDSYRFPQQLTELFKDADMLAAHPVKLSRFENNFMDLVTVPDPVRL